MTSHRGNPRRRRNEPRSLLTPAELLTLEFYAWEQRGRGWTVWPEAVQLEPPFVPFWHSPPTPPEPIDDGGRPTLASSILDRIKWLVGRLGQSDPPTPAEHVFPDAPEPFRDDDPLVEIRLTIPPTLKVAVETMERLLMSLPLSHSPYSFEFLAGPLGVTVQFACRQRVAPQFAEQVRAFFPDIVVTIQDRCLEQSWQYNEHSDASQVVVDFGLSQEFMLPLRTLRGFDVDPQTGLIGALGSLLQQEMVVFQVLFQPVRHRWPENIMRAVLDGQGRPFLADAPEVTKFAREKVAKPLFAAAVRLGIQAPTPDRVSQIARGLGGTLRTFGDPASNELIPLTNDDYEDAAHQGDLLQRRTQRSGMILNLSELAMLVHPPSASVRTPALDRIARKTKAAPAIVIGHDLVLGNNIHAGQVTPVGLSADQRSRHVYVIGASGTGKSTFLLNLIRQDLERGVGFAVLDPHGDLIDHILGFVPKNRIDDVVLLDPADAEFPVGLNIFSARTELERSLLASDLVAVFQRLSTSWGDQMTSVLGNAILAMLESDRGGTLVDLRRFLVEPTFRREFLSSVRDREIVYYWEKEFPLLAGKPQAPLLTRLDIFLRPKPIRYMVAQRNSRLDFPSVMNEGKIFLARLSQGAIGEENAYLLGTVLVSKFQQIAMSRQAMAAEERRPFYLYIDEFQNFVTPSMATILSGARKYQLGLVLAHQDLRQLQSRSAEVLSSVIANPCTRVCFRVGDQDARTLAEGLSTFDARDLQSLGTGQALVRVERSEYDFNLDTPPLPPVATGEANDRRERIIAHSRAAYATPRAEVAAMLEASTEAIRESREQVKAPGPTAPRRPAKPETVASEPPPIRTPIEAPSSEPPAVRAPLLTPPPAPRIDPAPRTPATGRGGRQHRYLQHLIQRWAEAHGWGATIEEGILDGLGSVDVALRQGAVSVACEISVSTTAEHEIDNVQKCLAAGFTQVAVISPDPKVLTRIRKRIADTLTNDMKGRLSLVSPEALFALLAQIEAEQTPKETTVRGYKVRVKHPSASDADRATAAKAVSQVIGRALGRLKKRT